MNKAVIFDLDGTLLDTLPDLLENVNLMLEHYGFPKVGREKVRLSIGNGATKLVERVLGDNYDPLCFDEHFKYYSNLYDKSQSLKTDFFEGIPTVLTELKKRGYKLAICTNKPQVPTDNVCEKYFKEFGFEMAVGLTDKVKKKPDPEATLNILEKLGVEKENAYFVGDGDTDVMTAKNAGVKSIAVLWGYRNKEDLEQAGATVFANKPIDLLDLIK
jgi:phosphoglycolate phosphatase